MNHGTTSSRRFWRSQGPALLALGGAALPKCPLCLLAIFGTAGLGLGASLPAGWLSGLTLASLSLLIGVFAAGAIRRRAVGPLALGLAAAAAVLAGKYQINSNTVVYAGMALLVAASLWNGWPRPEKSGACDTCDTCDTRDTRDPCGNGCGRKDGLSTHGL